MPRRLDHDELILRWTLVGDELERCRGKRGPSGLAFALVWKFCAQHGRFPRDTRELPDEAVGFVARQLGVDAAELVSFDWSGRTAERHRAELRELLGFRECTVADQEAAVEWLIAEVTTAEQRPDQVRGELLGWLRRSGVEPPTTGRLDRIVALARDRGERILFERVAARLPVGVRDRLNALVIGVPDEPDNEDVARGSGTAAVSGQVLAWVKTDPGRLSLNTMLDEIAKLEAIRAIELPDVLLDDIAVRIVSAWRVRAAVQAPSHLRELGARTRWVLLSALLAQRQLEITDTLVELLISTVHAIGARADKKVTEEMVASFARVRNKQGLLARLAEASLDRPDAAVREVVFPVAGGEDVLRQVVAEARGSRDRVPPQRAGQAARAEQAQLDKSHPQRGLVPLTGIVAQRETLLGLGVAPERLYLDHGLTGTTRARPGLDQALAAVRAGDTLVVPKLDRLARSVPDARAIGDDLAARGIVLSLGGSVYDPTDPMGKMFFNILATFAEFEPRGHGRRPRQRTAQRPGTEAQRPPTARAHADARHR